MTKRDKGRRPGEPVDKAAERLRQFKESRRPQVSEEPESPPATPKPGDVHKAPEPAPSNQKGGSSNERSDG